MSTVDSDEERKENQIPNLKKRRILETPSPVLTKSPVITKSPVLTQSPKSPLLTKSQQYASNYGPKSLQGTPSSSPSKQSEEFDLEQPDLDLDLEQPDLDHPLISEDLKISITNYMKHYLSLKDSSLELVASIKKHLLNATNIQNWKSVSNKFKEELRLIIRSTIYSRLPNLRSLLMDEKVTIKNIQSKLLPFNVDDDAIDDGANDDDNSNDHLYAKNEKQLVKLITLDKNYYKKYKKSVLAKESKIVREICKLASFENDLSVKEVSEKEVSEKSSKTRVRSDSTSTIESKESGRVDDVESAGNSEQSGGSNGYIVRSDAQSIHSDSSSNDLNNSTNTLYIEVMKLVLKPACATTPPLIFSKTILIDKPIASTENSSTTTLSSNVSLGFVFVHMPLIPVSPTIIFHIVGKEIYNLQLNILVQIKFKKATTIVILGSSKHKEEYSNVLLNQLNNHLEDSDNKWYPLKDSSSNLKCIPIQYGKKDKRYLYVYTKNKNLHYKSWDSVEETKKSEYLRAFELLANGYFFAEKFFYNVQSNTGLGIKTPLSTVIELTYTLYDELTDSSAVVLDIGCGIPCLVSGLSFLNSKTVYCSEIDDSLVRSLEDIIKTVESKTDLRVTLSDKKRNIFNSALSTIFK